MTTQYLILRIQSILDGSADLSDSQLRAIASEYKRVCENAARKLVHCASLIRAGRDYAALQVAETQPMLLESLNELVFARLGDWRNFCGVNSLLCPAPFDEYQIELVRSLYTREISQTHPLYRDYRRAMRMRDFDGALAIIRTISKVNNANSEAKKECEKLQKTVSLEKFEKIQDALENGDERLAMEIALSIMDFADDYLSNEKVWNQLKEKIAEYERKKAESRISEIVDELKDLEGSSDFTKVLALGAEYDILSNTLSLKKDSDDSEYIKAQISRASRLQEEKTLQENKAQACMELAAEIEHPDNDNIARALSKLLKLKEQAGDLLDKQLQKKVQTRIAILRSKIAFKRCVFAAVLLLVFAGAAYGFYNFQKIQMRERSYANANSDLIVMNQAQSIESLEAQLENFKKTYANICEEKTDIANKLEGIESRLASQKQIAESVKNTIAESEKNPTPQSLSELEKAEIDLMSLLPSDAAKLKKDVSALKQNISAQFEQIKLEYKTKLRDSLALASEQMENIDVFLADKSELDKIAESLKCASDIVALPTEIFKANTSEIENLNELQLKFDELKENTDAIMSAKNEMEQASDLEEYLDALAEFTEMQTTPKRIAESARKIIAAKALLENSIYMGVCDIKTATNLPEELGKKNIDFPTGTFEIYENVLKGEVVYTLGEVEESTRKWRGGGEIMQTANIITPTGESRKKAFSQNYQDGGRIIGSLLKKGGLTKESKLGQKAVEISISENPLKSIKAIIDSDAHPVFKLWLEAEFIKALEKDSISTGFVFSPSLQKRAEKVKRNAAGLDSAAWMSATSTKTNFIKNELYSEASPDFFAEAQEGLAKAKEAVKHPLKFAGYVGDSQNSEPKDRFGLNKKYEFIESSDISDFAKYSPLFTK